MANSTNNTPSPSGRGQGEGVFNPYPDWQAITTRLVERHGGDLPLLREMQKHVDDLSENYRAQIGNMRRGKVRDPSYSIGAALMFLDAQPAVSSGLAEDVAGLREVVAGLQAEVAALRNPGKRADKPAEPPQPAGDGGYDPAWPAEQVKRLALFLAWKNLGVNKATRGYHEIAKATGAEYAAIMTLTNGRVSSRNHHWQLDKLAVSCGFVAAERVPQASEWTAQRIQAELVQQRGIAVATIAQALDTGATFLQGRLRHTPEVVLQKADCLVLDRLLAGL